MYLDTLLEITLLLDLSDAFDLSIREVIVHVKQLKRSSEPS